jgi:hypothetical protein
MRGVRSAGRPGLARRILLRINLDAQRGLPPLPHIEWLAAQMRTAAQELAEGGPGKALKAVRRARLALR